MGILWAHTGAIGCIGLIKTASVHSLLTQVDSDAVVLITVRGEDRFEREDGQLRRDGSIAGEPIPGEEHQR